MRRTLLQQVSAVIFMIEVSVTFGGGGTCDECITIMPTSGEPSNLVGSYKKKTDQGKYNCPTSCAYEKENDGDNIWCFKAGAYKFDDKCSSSTPGQTPVTGGTGGSTSKPPHTSMETPISMGSSSKPPPTGETPISMGPHTSTKGPHGHTSTKRPPSAWAP